MMGDAKGVSFQPTQDEVKDGKPSTLDHLIEVLRKLLDLLVNCITCGCYPRPDESLHVEVYEAELMEQERIAVQDLLSYLDSVESKDPSISAKALHSLCILTYSDNEELQHSAALFFAELSSRMSAPLSAETLEPLAVLLKSRDRKVQKTATLAISNFALHGPESNKTLIVDSVAMEPLIVLLSSENLEVQCNTSGCITTLATGVHNKQVIAAAGGIRPLLALCRSRDVRVQRNATGALLNLTHLAGNRNELVESGALPALVESLYSPDRDIQYYSAAALSNLAVNERHRAMMVAVGHYDVIRRLLQLLGSSQEKVKCQACLALRNLASDSDNQLLIVRLRGLPRLHKVLQVARGDMLVASLACLRNLSIHRANEEGIISETFLCELRRLVVDSSNPEAQVHSAGTIRNLAAGEQIQAMTRSGCVEALVAVLLEEDTKQSVLTEVTAALAVLADEDVNKHRLLLCGNGDALQRLITLAVNCPLLDVRYNCAGTIGQLALTDIPPKILRRCRTELLDYLDVYFHSGDDSFIHIALWTLMQLLNYEEIQGGIEVHKVHLSLEGLLSSDHSTAIKELAQTIDTKIHSLP